MTIESLKSLKPLILVDGSSYLFRAYHALPPLTNSKGQPTGAIYGVLNMLKRLQKDFTPQYMAVVFDSKEPTFRKTLYPAYKANRLVMPDELQLQIEPLKKAIIALGLPLIIMPGVEADDIIAILAKKAAKQGLHTLISTGDKDLAQIVDEHTTLINTMSNTILDIEGVKQKFNVLPHQIIDYLALIGDHVDNIPGIPGVGPKTAAKWLLQYQTLENLISHVNEITGKVGDNLRQHLTELPLAKQLVSIKLDIAVPYTLSELTVTPPDPAALQTLFSELEFKNWLAEINVKIPPLPVKHDTIHYTIVNDKQTFQEWLTRLQTVTHFAMETLIADFNPLAATAKLIGIGFSLSPNENIYIPLSQEGLIPIDHTLEKHWVLSQLKPVLADSHKTIIGHHLKLTLQILAKEHINITANLWDNMLAAYVLDSASNRYDLESMVLRYLKQHVTSAEELLGKGNKQLSFYQLPVETAALYLTTRTHYSFTLHTELKEKISENQDLERVLNQIDFALLPVLSHIELHGVLIDKVMLNQQSSELQITCDQIQNQVYLLAGETFNLSSPKQLQTILFDKLKLPVSKKTPKGQASTAEDVLQELAHTYEIAKLILMHRNLTKLKTTYVDKLPLQINTITGRVHTCYQQTGTVTGRLSSKDPNLQNIPVRREEGRRIRRAFIAPLGYRLIAADYSQVELRIMAHLSQDPGLLSAFASNQDIHLSTAAEVFGVGLSEVTQDQRRNAKAINFGLMYGMSSFGLSQQLGISREQAQHYINIYFQRYPKVYQYVEESRQLAAKQGFVLTLFGRCITVADIKSNNYQRRQAAERAAINAPLQGSAADIIKLAMIDIDKQFLIQKIDAHMIMQVHDELVFEVKDEMVEITKDIIKQSMETVINLSVPLVVDIGIGNNWDEAH